MILLLSFLLAGCKQKTGMEILMSKMDDLKALKSQYVVHIEGEKDVVINVLYSKPNRILFTSDDFVVKKYLGAYFSASLGECDAC